MTTSLSQIRDLLLPGLDAVFGDYNELPNEWEQIFEKHTSDYAFERDVEMKMLGLAQQRSEGAPTTFEDMGERYLYTYRHIGVSLGFIFTKFAIRDNLYKQRFGPNSKALKHSMRQTWEVYAAAVLNNAMDTTGTYNGGDGVPLLSTQHPIDVGTYANTGTVQAELSETALQDAMVGVRRFKDAAGLRKLVLPRKLVVPPELQFVAQRILGATKRVGTGDNDPNALRDLGFLPEGWTINDFLLNLKSWYVITDCPDGFKCFQRDPLEVDMHVDFTTDNLLTKATERKSFGWSNARAVYGMMP